MSDKPAIQTSHAVLLLNGKYVLQLRDNIPTIAAPGQWSFFGGKIDDNEEPAQAMQREVLEELSIKPGKFKYLWFTDYFDDFFGENVRTWFFEADVSKVWNQHKLNEGQVVQAFNYEELANLKIPPVMRDALERHHNQ